MQSIRRRDFLAGSLALVAGAGAAHAAPPKSLREIAAEKGMVFGCAVKTRTLADDPAFAQLVSSEAGILVPEYELKREVVEPAPGRFDFAPFDTLAAFARRNGQTMRGHTLCWYTANPPWLEGALGKAGGNRSALLADYVQTVVRRTDGVIKAWDVVNEAVDPDDGRPDGLRSNCLWYQAFGEDYIRIAFEAARAADPNAVLYLNDFGVEADVSWNERRRTAVLKLLERMVSKGIPVDAFGVQGHLKAYQDRFDEDIFHRFLTEIEAMGLKLLVTEFDVADVGGPIAPATRDADVAALTRSFLDVAFSVPAMGGMLCWGLSDRYSWLSKSDRYKWPGTQLSRGLPYDGGLHSKPMRQAIADAFSAAPSRG